MSKKEIRRAARDAFPKAKNASAARRRGSGGAYGKRTYSAGSSGGASRTAVRPPSLKRSAIVGTIWAVLYFAVIQWVWKSGGSLWANLIFAVAGVFVFTGIFYWLDRIKYRRYVRKNQGPSK